MGFRSGALKSFLLLLSFGTAAAASGGDVAQGQQAPPATLFADSAAPAVLASESFQPAVVRSRFVTVNVALLPDQGALDIPPARGARLLLNLFDDVSLVAVVDRLDPNATGVTWVGHVEGVALSSVTLVTEAGVMAGSIVMPQGAYAVRYAGPTPRDTADEGGRSRQGRWMCRSIRCSGVA